MKEYSIFWFRRDLRLDDNVGLYNALKSGNDVIPLFIFDKEILDNLENKKDKRVVFIHNCLKDINKLLETYDTSLLLKYGKPLDIWEELIKEFHIKEVYTNHDYEPNAIQRDKKVEKLLSDNNIKFKSFKDQVIFEKSEILNNQGEPYKVYTPYKNKWLELFGENNLSYFPSEKNLSKFYKYKSNKFLSLKDIGFEDFKVNFPSNNIDKDILKTYDKTRNFPYLDHGTTKLGLHLRFGTISIRKAVNKAKEFNEIWLSELIWREFFMMILFHFPHVINKPFHEKYSGIKWKNDKDEFKSWCEGKTGYPIVDAGMRELNETGHMHNRVRMITASFLTKHLLIDWIWGERYFAEKLLDYELSSNNGNWQWAAGTGCDASPYFRVFNPETQMKKFDKDLKYVKKWVKELDDKSYPKPIVEHSYARERALKVYKEGIENVS